METLVVWGGAALCLVWAGAKWLKPIFSWNVHYGAFMAQINKLVNAGNHERAIKLCNAAPNAVIPQVVQTCLVRSNGSKEDIRGAFEFSAVPWREKLDDRRVNAVEVGIVSLVWSGALVYYQAYWWLIAAGIALLLVWSTWQTCGSIHAQIGQLETEFVDRLGSDTPGNMAADPSSESCPTPEVMDASADTPTPVSKKTPKKKENEAAPAMSLDEITWPDQSNTRSSMPGETVLVSFIGALTAILVAGAVTIVELIPIPPWEFIGEILAEILDGVTGAIIGLAVAKLMVWGFRWVVRSARGARPVTSAGGLLFTVSTIAVVWITCFLVGVSSLSGPVASIVPDALVRLDARTEAGAMLRDESGKTYFVGGSTEYRENPVYTLFKRKSRAGESDKKTPVRWSLGTYVHQSAESGWWWDKEVIETPALSPKLRTSLIKTSRERVLPEQEDSYLGVIFFIGALLATFTRVANTNPVVIKILVNSPGLTRDEADKNMASLFREVDAFVLSEALNTNKGAYDEWIVNHAPDSEQAGRLSKVLQQVCSHLDDPANRGTGIFALAPPDKTSLAGRKLSFAIGASELEVEFRDKGLFLEALKERMEQSEIEES